MKDASLPGVDDQGTEEQQDKPQELEPAVSVPTKIGAVASVSETGFVLNWPPPSEGFSQKDGLEYFVCSGPNLESIDTVNECTNATKEMDWSKDTLTLVVSNKKPDQTYYFNILVRDGSGTVLAYEGISQATKADSAPPSTGKFEVISNLDGKGFTLNWTAAHDLISEHAELTYYVCSASDLKMVSSIDDCKAATQEMDWSANRLSVTVEGKTKNTRYHVNVMVKDAAGNIAIYSARSVSTKAQFPKIAIGHENACLIADDQSLWCWGNNYNGQLHPDEGDVGAPIQIGVDKDWVELSMSSARFAVLLGQQ